MGSPHQLVLVLFIFSCNHLIPAQIKKHVVHYKYPVKVALDETEQTLLITPPHIMGIGKSSTLYDYNTRMVAYKDLENSLCFLEKMKSTDGDIKYRLLQLQSQSPFSSLRDTTKTMYVSDKNLTKYEVWKLAGLRIASFCQGSPATLLQEIRPQYHDFELNNELQDDVVLEKQIVKYRPRRQTTTYSTRGYSNRYRGQTQSQYLGFQNGGETGRAEAESSSQISRTHVSGTHGMGQAQSQSLGGGCEECFPGAVSGYPGSYQPGALGIEVPSEITGQVPGVGVPDYSRPGIAGYAPGVGVPGARKPGEGLPEDRVPGIGIPGARLPGVGVPGAQIPGYVPGARIPGYAPGVGVPGEQIPSPGVLGPQGPIARVPGAQIPGYAPGVGVPGAQIPGVGVPGARIPGYTPDVRVPGAQIPGVGIPGAHIPGYAPDVSVPGAQIPGYTPDVRVPGTQIPGLGVPGAQIPGIGVPGAQIPGIGVPGAQIPGIGVPGAQIPGVGVPGTRIPGYTPGVGVPEAQIPGIGVLGAQIPGVGVPGTRIPGYTPGVGVPEAQIPGIGVPGAQIPGVGVPGTRIPGVGVPGAQLPGYAPRAQIPGLYQRGYGLGDSQAESSIKKEDNETRAVASAQGKYGEGTAQTQVSGIYSGSGSFSAQAQTSDKDRGAQSQVLGGSEGATSTAQGQAGGGKSQTQVQLGTATGGTTAEAQSGGSYYGTNTQVQAGSQGGMADAQATGQGSTSSQAQIGFLPYLENEKINEQRTPFRGGGSASAQSGAYTGQSQSQIQGSFIHGVSYTGAAQAGSGLNNGKTNTLGRGYENFGGKLGLVQTGSHNTETSQSNRLSLGNQQSQSVHTPINGGISSHSSRQQRHYAGTLQQSSNLPSHIEYDDDEVEDDEDDTTYDDRGTILHRTTNDLGVARNGIQKETFEQGLQRTTMHSSNNQIGRNGRNSTGNLGQPTQTQHVILGPLNGHGAHIIQDSDDGQEYNPGDVLQPGQTIHGSTDYIIPKGYRGRITSVSGPEKTSAQGGQAQTVILTPGSGNVTYSNPSSGSYQPAVMNIPVGHTRSSKPNTHSGQSTQYRQSNRRNGGQSFSTYNHPNPDSFVTVTKSVTGQLDNGRANNGTGSGGKYTHTYYTKSSTCGYFTFSCNIVFGSNGRTRICKPNPPTNAD
ncbi:hypothetical protein L9F63_009741, partial [Diploptera punctata]